MNNKVNYTIVGFLVLFGIVMMLVFSYWMLKPSDQEQTQIYRIYFNESVFGLNINAPVKYRGISVGKVVNLRINPHNTEQVEATVNIIKSTPIKENTIAKLTAQGITGLTYINLTLGSNKAPRLKAKKGEKYPVIKSAPSFFEHFEKSLGSLSAEFSDTLHNTNRMLNNKNQEQITIILNRTANIMDKVDRILDEKTMKHFRASVKNLDDFSDKLNKMTPKIDKFVTNSIVWEGKMSDSFISIKETYTGMGKIMNNMAKSFSNVENDIQDISLNVVPTLNNTMLNVQNTLIKFDGLMREYKRSPSDILFKKEDLKRGPGEK